MEYKLHRDVVLGIEYNFVNLDGGTFNTTTGGAVPGLPIAVNLNDVEIHSVAARLSILLQ